MKTRQIVSQSIASKSDEIYRKAREFILPNCVWMNKNSSPKLMTKVFLSWRIMFDMVCEPL